MRLAQANEINGIEGLAEILGVTLMSLLISSPKEVLARLGIISVFATSSSGSCDAPYRAYMGVAGRTIRSRICAECLESMPVQHIRASWDRALEMNCRFHHNQLLDECPACHAPITYRRKKVASCDCGFNFSNAPSNDGVGFNVSKLYQIFGLQDVYSKEAPTYGNSGPTEVLAVTVIQRLTLLETGMTATRRPPGAKGDAFVSARSLTFLKAWFERWPEGFIRSIACTRNGIHPALTGQVMGYLQSSSNAFPVIKLALQELAVRKRRSPRPVNRSPQMVKAEGAPHVGIKYVIKATGSTYDAVKHWISQGWLGQVETFDKAKGQLGYRIDSARAQKAIQIVKSTSSARELSASVGIDKLALRALAQCKVIRSIPYGRGVWNVRFLPIDVFQLASALLNIANRGVATNDRRLLLQQAIALLRDKTPGLIKPFINAVLERQISISFIGKRPCRLDEITLRYADLINWRNGFLKTASEAKVSANGRPIALLALSKTG